MKSLFPYIDEQTCQRNLREEFLVCSTCCRRLPLVLFTSTDGPLCGRCATNIWYAENDEQVPDYMIEYHDKLEEKHGVSPIDREKLNKIIENGGIGEDDEGPIDRIYSEIREKEEREYLSMDPTDPQVDYQEEEEMPPEMPPQEAMTPKTPPQEGMPPEMPPQEETTPDQMPPQEGMSPMEGMPPGALNATDNNALPE